jgi:transcriptional antiterminator RfaH
MPWYLVHTKPRQELRALENLHRQSFVCLLPMLGVERVRQRRLTVVEEPLFPRYLFIELGDDVNWAPIRSTLGVINLVRFGSSVAKVPQAVIDGLRQQQASLTSQQLARPLFTQGQPVRITAGPFAGLEAVFDMTDGDARAMLLIELLSKQVRLPVEVTHIRASQAGDEVRPTPVARRCARASDEPK